MTHHSKNIVIGIDADTEQIAWAVLRDGRHVAHGTIPRTHLVKGLRVFHQEYLDNVKRFFTRCAERGAAVYVEDIYLAFVDGKPAVTTYKALACVQGELVIMARQAGVDMIFVAPVKWQRAVLGVAKGRDAIQAASFARAEALAGAPVESPHEADACCIAAFGAGVVAEAQRTAAR